MTDSKRRRWFQISLRTFLVVLTIGCVWLGVTVRRATLQRKAVEWITESSGRAWYDFQIDNPRGLPVEANSRASSPGTPWNVNAAAAKSINGSGKICVMEFHPKL